MTAKCALYTCSYSSECAVQQRQNPSYCHAQTIKTNVDTYLASRTSGATAKLNP